MAGLMAARVLADGYERVTLLERDPLPDDPEGRRSVRQSEHVHVMQEPGRVILNDFFPGYQEELQSEGGLVINAAKKLQFYEGGDYITDPETDLPMQCASRPLFEHIVRRRVANIESVTLREECHCIDYLTDHTDSSVAGVAFRTPSGDTGTVLADLVVDATGRTSRISLWLDDHGYHQPPVDRVSINLAYSTVTITRPAGQDEAYLVSPSAPDTRGGAAIPIEGNRWIVTLFGMHGDHPPTERDEFITFADTLAAPTIAELLTEQTWLSEEIHQYPFPSSQWRHYESLDDYPTGLVVTGDAIMSVNPIYGQGMSAAALDALQLHHTLAEGKHNIGPRFLQRAEEHLTVIWQIAVSSDFEFDETVGPKPLGTDLFNYYISRLVHTAHTDKQVAEAFTRVLRLEKQPITLLRPNIMIRVLTPS